MNSRRYSEDTTTAASRRKPATTKALPTSPSPTTYSLWARLVPWLELRRRTRANRPVAVCEQLQERIFRPVAVCERLQERIFRPVGGCEQLPSRRQLGWLGLHLETGSSSDSSE